MTHRYIAGGLLFASLICLCMAADSAGAGQGPERQRPVVEVDKPIAAEAIVELVELAYAPEEAAEPEAQEAPETPLSAELTAVLVEACGENGVPVAVGLGLIETESRFEVDAVNPRSGCYGLCQLSPQYFPGGLSPAENIRAGIGYLGEQLAKYGDLDAALCAYHDGHDTGRRWYAEEVMARAEAWSREEKENDG